MSIVSNTSEPCLNSRLRLAWVSSLAEYRQSRCALFSKVILPELRNHFLIECFTDDPDLDSGEAFPFPTFHYHRLAERMEKSGFDGFVFQIENSLRSQFSRLCAKLIPGITIFHDLTLNELYLGLYRYTTAPTELNELAQREFGSSAPPFGDYHVRNWPLDVFNRRFRFGKGDALHVPAVVVLEKRHERLLTRMGYTGVVRAISAPAYSILRTSTETPTLQPLQVIFSGEYILADRWESFVSVVRRCTDACLPLRFHWVLPNERKMADAIAFAGTSEALEGGKTELLFYSSGIDGISSLLAGSKACFLSLRSDPYLASARGLIEARRMGHLVFQPMETAEGRGYEWEYTFACDGTESDLIQRLFVELIPQAVRLGQIGKDSSVAIDNSVSVGELCTAIHEIISPLQQQLKHRKQELAIATRRLLQMEIDSLNAFGANEQREELIAQCFSRTGELLPQQHFEK